MAVLAVASPVEQPAVPTPTPSCVKTFDQQAYRQYSRAVYLHRRSIKRSAKRRLARMLKCQQNGARARHLSRKYRAKLWKKRKAWLEAMSLTPYDCGQHGRFAVPCYIVACESHFSWTARNPSGAWGAYQLLGWLPYGSSRLAQHRMAAKLWAGGSGAHHWVCA